MGGTVEAIREPLGGLASRISSSIGVDPAIIVDGSKWGRLWSDRVLTTHGWVRAGSRLAISQEHIFENVLRIRVFGEIDRLDRGPRWSRLYLAEPVDLERIRGRIPRGLDNKIFHAVLRAWEDTHRAQSLETIHTIAMMRLQEERDLDSFE